MKRFKYLYTLLMMIVAITLFSTSATAPDGKMINLGQSQSVVKFYGGQAKAGYNGADFEIDGEILNINSRLYVASDKLLAKMGYGMGWKADISAVVAVKNEVVSYIITQSPVLWKGYEKYVSMGETMVYGGVFYIPMDMFEYLTDCKAEIIGEVKAVSYHKRDLLEDTYVGDGYRLKGTAQSYNNVYLSGNFGMERVLILNDGATYYAAIVNELAESLPESVNVYNIVVPTASEFYGPSNVYTNQTEGIRTVYKNLSQRVIPINVVKPLYEHAGESIYFRTDHHWTQRGAYYAYKAFVETKGETVPPLSSFVVKTGAYTGSLANFAKGTYAATVFKNNPDNMERFLAPNFKEGASYNDMYMKSYNRSVRAVYENTNSYVAFLGGDNPLTVMTSNVNNGKKIVIMKESFGNAFATWALNNYSEVYVIDVRKFNKGQNSFKLREFYDFVKFDDLVIINYPVSVSSSGMRISLQSFK